MAPCLRGVTMSACRLTPFSGLAHPSGEETVFLGALNVCQTENGTRPPETPSWGTCLLSPGTCVIPGFGTLVCEKE